MNYCTYPEYQTAGGTVSELAFGVLCSRASRLIDSATFGKAEPHAAVCESCRMPVPRSWIFWPQSWLWVRPRALPASPTTATA